MKVYAIGDLHLDSVVEKPMDIFGPGWDNHWERIVDNWKSRVTEDDMVLIPGDISWAMRTQEAIPDLELIKALPGKKIIIRGNHDYWWESISEVRSLLDENMWALQNDSIRINNVIVCGTRGWAVPEKEFKTKDDEKIYNRELIRMELALQDLAKKRQEGDTAIAMIHYPPFNAKLLPSEFTRLFEQYKIDKVVYGHLHGRGCRACKYLEQNGIQYYLTSCDQVNCELVEILGENDGI